MMRIRGCRFEEPEFGREDGREVPAVDMHYIPNKTWILPQCNLSPNLRLLDVFEN